MAQTVKAYSPASGTHYLTAHNAAGQWFNGSAFEAYNAANWSTYVIAATSLGNGWYSASLDDNARSYDLRLRAGGSPAATDAAVAAYPVIPVAAAMLPANFASLQLIQDEEVTTLYNVVVAGQSTDAGYVAIPTVSGGGGGDIDLDAIANTVAARLAGNAVNTSALVVRRGVMELIAGDAYPNARMQPFQVTNWTGTNLNNAEGTMRFMPLSEYERVGDEAVATLVVDGTFAQSGTTVTMNFPMTAEQTALLVQGESVKGVTHYKVQVAATVAKESPWLGRAAVSRNIPES